MITRLLFVWFIKQKGLVPDDIFDVDKLKQTLKNFNPISKDQGTYYNAILQNLFFATLNRAIIDDEGNPRRFANRKDKRDMRNLYRYAEMFKISEDEVLDLFAKVPFLNGGLFECLDKFKKTEIQQEEDVYYDGFSRNEARFANGNLKYRAFVPNVLFFNDDEVQPGLINLFSQYNFTIEENSVDDTDISLDPELLGLVFENLLAAYNPETQESARKATGSFYTPREIVNYMVNESLITHINQQCNDIGKQKIRTLFRDNEKSDGWTEQQCKDVIKALKEMKILDPACGSGAFPMGCLLRIVEIIECLQGHSENRYELKLHLIENCIFGIDIQPIAMLISKLRFFISLICEQKDIDFSSPETNYGVNTLPNLETKFVAANTLIGADIRNYDNDWTKDEDLQRMQQELLNIRHNHFYARSQYKKEKDREADAAKCDEILAYILEYKSKPDENKISMLKRQIQKYMLDMKQYEGEYWVDEVTQPIMDLFEEPKSTLFRHDSNKEKRDEIKKAIARCESEIKKEQNKNQIKGFEAAVKQVTSWNPYNQNASSPFFDAEWMFGVKDGFDVVIGNPPYLRIQGIRETNNEFADLLSQKYKSATGSFDLYVIFVERAFDIIKNSGVVYYIMPVKWTNSSFGKGLRQLLSQNKFASSIISFGAYQVFNASTYTGIQKFSKSSQLSYLELDRDLKSNTELGSYLNCITDENFVNIPYDTSNAWILTSRPIYKVLEKIYKCPYRLSDIFDKIFQGIATSKDNVYFLYDCIENEGKIEGFSKQLQRRVSIEKGLVKPLLKGEDVHRYYNIKSDRFIIFPYSLEHNQALLYTEQQLIELFPLGYKYLKECEPELRGRENGRFNNDMWYVYGRGQGINYSSIPKLLAPEISLGGNFAYDINGQYYNTTTIYGYIRRKEVETSYETLLAIMNSDLCWWFLKHTGSVLANGYFRFKPAYLKPFPFPNISEENDMKIKKIVKEIMHNDDYKSGDINNQINRYVYELYNLDKNDINIISNNL